MNDLLARLIAAGTPADLVAEIAMEFGRIEGERKALERRREAERENTARYRARGGGQVPGWLRQQVFERDGFRCVDCGSEERLECDHILPLAKGGGNEEENLQTLCKPCNARKRDRFRKQDERRLTRTNADSADKGGSGQPEPAKEIPPDPHKKTSPPVCPDGQTAPRGRADRGFRIPDDWQPPAIEDLPPEAQALAKQWPANAYRAEGEAFRNFWLAESGARARKSKWNSAWYNRIVQVHSQVMRAAKFTPQPQLRAVPDKPMTAEGHDKLVTYFMQRGEPLKADWHRREAAELRRKSA